MSKVDSDAPAYRLRVTRVDHLGSEDHIEFDCYGVLRELFDDIEAEAEKRGWFKESDPDEPALLNASTAPVNASPPPLAPPTVTDAMVEAAIGRLAAGPRGYRDNMRDAISAALQAQRGE